MLLLLRWSGLRLGDASRLERSALTKDGNLRLYMQKTGEPVQLLIAAERCRGAPRPERIPAAIGISSGTERRLPVLLSNAGGARSQKYSPLPTCQMLTRTSYAKTFAVEMLLAGVPIDQVSILLGHSSVKITEKHYAPWVAARQRQLEDSVKRAWAATA